MYVDRILYPVTALGPGERIAIWTAGCGRRCAGCANPELWERHPEQYLTPEALAGYVNRLADRKIDGITVTGGEPFGQAEELVRFLDGLSFRAEVLIFTGYMREELEREASFSELLGRTDVLIDGPYVKEANDGKAALRGSLNQRIHYLNPGAEAEYERYLSAGRQIQNFVYDYRILSVGIHKQRDSAPETGHGSGQGGV